MQHLRTFTNQENLSISDAASELATASSKVWSNTSSSYNVASSSPAPIVLDGHAQAGGRTRVAGALVLAPFSIRDQEQLAPGIDETNTSRLIDYHLNRMSAVFGCMKDAIFRQSHRTQDVVRLGLPNMFGVDGTSIKFPAKVRTTTNGVIIKSFFV